MPGETCKIRACQTGDTCYGKPQGENLDKTADTSNRLVGFTYDAAGNQTNDGGPYTATYDAENRISAYSSATYTYDGDGRRVKKSTGTLYWTGTGSDALAESDLAGAIQRELVFFSGKRIARLDGTGASPTIHYYFSDHLGSADVVTNAQGTTIEEESDYYPYGGERVVTDTLANQNYKFTGKERDTESGLDYFGARYYASAFARWTSPDKPFADQLRRNPQSWNLYVYVRNNPLTQVDPDGEKTELAIGGNTTDNPAGHASIIINDKVYSYGTNYTKGEQGTKDWGADASKFLQEQNNERQTNLLELDITPEQEAKLQASLDANNPYGQGKPPYDVEKNSCVTVSEKALENTGIVKPEAPKTHDGVQVRGPSLTPADLGNKAQRQGLVKAIQTVGTQKTSMLKSTFNALKSLFGRKKYSTK